MSDAYAADMTFSADPVTAEADFRSPLAKPDMPFFIFEYFGNPANAD